MTDRLKVHAIIYSWPSVQARSFEMARELAAAAQRVSVVTCTDEPIDIPADVETFVLPNSCYFGQQFKKTIEVFDGDVLLQVAGDTSTPSWAAVVRQCEARFQAIPALGIWTPDIDGTTWPNNRVFLYNTNDPQLFGVVQTDCIVWAIRSDIIAYLKSLDYSCTPLGWGIDWAAIAHAYANKLRVMRDLSVKVHHRIGGSGYDRLEADRQKDVFLSRLSDDEKIQLCLISGVMNGRGA